MKTKSFSPASVTPDASWVGFSPVSALAGVSFAVSGVDGHALRVCVSASIGVQSRERDSDLAKPAGLARLEKKSDTTESRYQARPDCNSLLPAAKRRVCRGAGTPDQSLMRWTTRTGAQRAFGLSARANGQASKPMMAPDRLGELVSLDGHAGCGGNPHALNSGRWPNTPVLFRLYNGAVASRTLIDSENDLGAVVTAGETAKICEGMAGSPASAGAGSTSALRATCHPKRSWLCRVAAGFIHALGGRDIAIRTRTARPTATGNSRLASGHAPSLQFFNRESSVRIRPGYASRGVKVTALKMTPENGTKRVSGHWSKAVALFGSVLFAFASVAMGDPGHGTDLNRMNHANALFSALSQVESGDNDRAIGPKGERTRYQILPAVWKRFGGGANPVEPVSALRVAELVMRPRVDSFIKTQGRPPSAQEWYLLWHCPARVMSPRKSDTQKAERFANLVK